MLTSHEAQNGSELETASAFVLLMVTMIKQLRLCIKHTHLPLAFRKERLLCINLKKKKSVFKDIVPAELDINHSWT